MNLKTLPTNYYDRMSPTRSILSDPRGVMVIFALFFGVDLVMTLITPVPFSFTLLGQQLVSSVFFMGAILGGIGMLEAFYLVFAQAWNAVVSRLGD